MAGHANILGFYEMVWSVPYIPPNKTQHETDCNQIVKALGPHDFVAGPIEYEADRKLIFLSQQDGEVRCETHYLERERGKGKRTSEICRRMGAYDGCPHEILWVLDTGEIRHRYIAVSAEFPQLKIWCAVYADVLDDPHGHVWFNHREQTTKL